MNEIEWLKCFAIIHKDHPLDPNDLYLETETVNEIEDTALILACKLNRGDIVKILLKHKANINITNLYDESPLYCAILNRSLEIVYMLLQVDYMKISFNRALELAYDMDWFYMFELLLRHGAEITDLNFMDTMLKEKNDKQYITHVLSNKQLLGGELMHAILMTFNNDLIDCMIDNLPDLTMNNCCAYYYPFYLKTKRIDVLDKFIKHGANINFYSNYAKYTLVGSALNKSDIDFVELLCKENYDINFNEVLLNIPVNDIKIIDYVMSKGVNINYMNKMKSKETILINAYNYNCYDTAEYLLKLGANPNLYKIIPPIRLLTKCSDNTQIKHVKLMIKNGLDSAKAMSDIFIYNIQILKLLLKTGIQPNYIDQYIDKILYLINHNELKITQTVINVLKVLFINSKDKTLIKLLKKQYSLSVDFQNLLIIYKLQTYEIDGINPIDGIKIMIH